MIFSIIFVLLLIIGSFIDLDNKKKNKNTDKHHINTITAIGTLGTAICIILTTLSIASNISNRNFENKKQIERENYVDLLEVIAYKDHLSDDDIDIIKDVYQFNKDVKLYKNYNKSLWIGWFVEDYYDDIEEIDLSKCLKESEEK